MDMEMYKMKFYSPNSWHSTVLSASVFLFLLCVSLYSQSRRTTTECGHTLMGRSSKKHN